MGFVDFSGIICYCCVGWVMSNTYISNDAASSVSCGVVVVVVER